MEVSLFDVQNENKAILEAKRSLELIDLLEICSEGSSSFICDLWVKFKPEYYMYWGQDFTFASISDCKNYGGVGMIHFMDYLKLE